MKLSVVIAVYNTANFIKQCMASLLVQCHELDVEILLIDDGSTDHSPSICQEYVSQYAFVKYYRKDNEGLFSSRNLGLSLAKGDFILFLDSDDIIQENLIAENFNQIYEGKNDVIIFGYRKIIETNRGTNTFEILPPKTNSNDSYTKTIIKLLESGCGFSVWNQIWRKSFLINNMIFFPPMKRGADMAFLLNAYQHLPSIQFNRNIYYNYIAFDNSGKRDFQMIQNHVEIFKSYLNLTYKLEESDIVKSYTCKLLTLWFCHVIPTSLYKIAKSNHDGIVKIYKEYFENDDINSFVAKVKINDTEKLLTKLMLIILKLRSPLALLLFTKIKQWVKYNLKFNYRKLS